MNWRLIKPFTFSLLFASQTRRHGRIVNILVFRCIRGKPFFYDAKYWYKLCIKWLATNCSPFSASSTVAGHSLGKVPKTFPSGFCVCYWVDIQMAGGISQPHVLRGKETCEFLCLGPQSSRPPGWWLVAMLPGTRAGISYGRQECKAKGYCGFGS